MADKNVDKNATDLFGLGSPFHAQDSSIDTTLTITELLDADGEIEVRAEYDEKYMSDASYGYAGSDLGADFTEKVGQVVTDISSNYRWIDSIEFRFSAGQPVNISISGHNHETNEHEPAGSGEYDGYDLDLDTLIGTQGGFDVPSTGWDSIWANANAESCLTALTLRFTVDHMDEVCGDGDHAVGADSRGLVNATAEYLGVPSLTTTGWNIESDRFSDGNQAFDRHTVTGSKKLTRTTA